MGTPLTFFFRLLSVPPRWPTRVFAAESVRRVIQVCDGNTVHFDIEMAREMRTKTGGGKTDMHFDYVIQHEQMRRMSANTILRNEGKYEAR